MSRLVSSVAPLTFPPDPLPPILLGGSVNLLAGAPNLGKTALLAWMLRQFRDGGPIFGYTPSPPPTIAIISVDRSWGQSSKLWFDLVGYPDIRHYSLQDDLTFQIDRLGFKQQRMAILAECLDRLALPWGSLVALDPAAPFLGGNLLDYDACMVACTKIRRLCLQRGLTILGLSHAGKLKSNPKDRYQKLEDRIIGSAAQFGYTDTAMYLASPEETGEPFYTFLWAPHHAPKAFFKLARTDEGLFVPWVDQSDEERGRILRLIPELPEDIPLADLLLECLDFISRATLHRRLQDLLTKGHILRTSKGRYAKPASN
jgi:hypothetical protein